MASSQVGMGSMASLGRDRFNGKPLGRDRFNSKLLGKGRFNGKLLGSIGSMASS